MFNTVYTIEVVNEEEFYVWENEGDEQYGRGNAIMSVKSFFEWLRSDEEAPNQAQTK